jgi:hypothetical protein
MVATEKGAHPATNHFPQIDKGQTMVGMKEKDEKIFYFNIYFHMDTRIAVHIINYFS